MWFAVVASVHEVTVVKGKEKAMAMTAESRPWTMMDYTDESGATDFDLLVELGVALPFPDALTDGEVGVKLWEVIGRLAGLGVYLVNTDHLSDRELYERLWADVLREEPWSDAVGSKRERCTIIDMVGSGSPEEILEWLTYYADETARQDWVGEFLDEGLPDHLDPPFDRDRLLPSPLFCKDLSSFPSVDS